MHWLQEIPTVQFRATAPAPMTMVTTIHLSTMLERRTRSRRMMALTLPRRRIALHGKTRLLRLLNKVPGDDSKLRDTRATLMVARNTAVPSTAPRLAAALRTVARGIAARSMLDPRSPTHKTPAPKAGLTADLRLDRKAAPTMPGHTSRVRTPRTPDNLRATM